MYIQNKEMTRLFNSQSWMLAQRYYHHQYLSDVWIQSYETYYHIQAKFNIFEKVVFCTLDLNQQGLIIHFQCSCDACHEDEEGCAHLGCLILFLHTVDHISFPYQWHRDASVEENYQVVVNHLEIQKLLHYYQLLDKPIKEIHLIATFQMTPSPMLVYQIGHQRFYKLKDLEIFIKAYMRHEIWPLGKQLSIPLLKVLFDDFSKQQLDFIKRYAISHRGGMGQGILIDERNIDDFYQLYQNAKIPHQICFKTQQHLSIKVQKEKNFVCLSLDHEEQYIIGQEALYYLEDGCYYRFEDEIFHQIVSLVTFFKHHSQIFISIEQMKSFYEYVLEDSSTYMTLYGDDLQSFKPADMTPEIYIDALQDGLQVSVFYQYDTKRYPIYDDEHDLDQRHRRFEMRLLHLIEPYADRINKEKGTLWISLEHHHAFDFMEEVIPKLSFYSHVYLHENLQMLSYPMKLSLKIGVRLHHDLLELHLEQLNIPKEDIIRAIQAYRSKKHYLLLSHGGYLNLQNDLLKHVVTWIDTMHIPEQELTKSIEVPVHYAPYVQNLADTQDMFLLEENFIQYMKNFNTSVEEDIPSSLEAILRPYQKEGYQWLCHALKHHMGVILADDMGLGKTLQMLALIEKEFERNHTLTCLLVCPSSLILNWKDEILRFTPRLSYQCIMGDASTRTKLIQNPSCLYLTSYDYLRKDVALYQNMSFDIMILDEAQYIKNQGTKNAHVVKSISCKQRFALTGTPIENSLSELWSIFDFLIPGYLGSYRSFKNFYEFPIVRWQDEERLSMLRKKVSPFILRRMKKDVLTELPEKIETTLKISFNESEKKVYYAHLAMIHDELRDYLGLHDGNVDRISVLAQLTKLRQICLDMRLVDDTITQESSKMIQCLDMIETAKVTHQKVLVFSSFKSALDLLSDSLEKRSIAYYKMTGETSKMDRYHQIECFQQDDTPAFLISLKAGGTGINLTSAHIVIHLDPWWNIASMNQATDRAYRLGQKRNVHVYKYVMEDSIEEKIMLLQEKKKLLSDTLLQRQELSLSSLSQEELLSLFEI